MIMRLAIQTRDASKTNQAVTLSVTA